MDRELATSILEDANEITRLIGKFNKKYEGVAEIFSVNAGIVGASRIHLSDGGNDLISALQPTVKFVPFDGTLFSYFNYKDTDFWFGEALK